MRTKSLLLTAALATAGLTLASAQAQGQTFSVNAVGFVNVELPQGFSMVANPLDAEDNSVSSLFPGEMPDGTTLYKFDSESGQFSVNSFVFGAWDNPDQELAPGDGAFINVPSATSVTFVGEVMQGTLENEIPSGFSIKSSMVPQSGQLDTDLGFPASDGDTVYMYDNASSQYSVHSYAFGSWDTPPEPSVGEAFWVNKLEGTTWTREFSVNN